MPLGHRSDCSPGPSQCLPYLSGVTGKVLTGAGPGKKRWGHPHKHMSLGTPDVLALLERKAIRFSFEFFKTTTHIG